MGEAPDGGEAGTLRFLRRLVTVLTVTMIAGFLVLIATLVTRLSATPPPLPEAIVLPDGVTARAFTQAEDWYAVVTEADEILIYARGSGRLVQRVRIENGR